VFHSDPPIEDRVIVIRDITRGVNAVDIGLAVLVNDHAVVHDNAAVFEHVGRWLDADTHDDKVALRRSPPFVTTQFTRRVPSNVATVSSKIVRTP
jgi:hypothetical protein